MLRKARVPGRAARRRKEAALSRVNVDGVGTEYQVTGQGTPVILLHGFPDSGRLWRHQVPVLVEHGFRVIVPDLRGFGRSGRPEDVASYRLPTIAGDVTAVLDAFGIQTAHVVGHDWGAAVAWMTAIVCPERVNKLTVMSVPHLLAAPTLRQYEKGWYQLFFQFA